jgi:hypothetical protein
MRKNVGSPLSNRVNSRFGGSVNHRSKKIIAGFLIATIGPLVATTLAASVTIGNGGNLEFGQGSQAAVACDSVITTSITETWYEAGTFFRVATMSLTGLDTTACTGKYFKLSLLGSTGTALTVGSAAETSITVKLTDVSGSQATGSTLAGSTASLSTTGTNNTLLVTLNAAVYLNASTVYRVTVETS